MSRGRRSSRSPRASVPKRVVAVLGLLVLVGLLWTGYRVAQVGSSLRSAQSDAQRLESALAGRDVGAARAALTDLQDHSRTAADGSDGPAWWWLTLLPRYGDDAEAVAVMSGALADVSADGLAPLLDIADAVEEGAFTPTAGRVPVDRLTELQEPVRSSTETFESVDGRLAALDGEYVAQLEEARARLGDAVGEAARRLGDVRLAVEVLPTALGADGPRTYLLVLENNAEVRSTGGFPGQTFLLTADDGRIALGDAVAGATYGEREAPVVPLTAAEEQLFSDRVGTRFVDANSLPDFPRVAQIWSAMWRDRFGGELDGVIATDPVLLSYLLRGGRPIVVDGVELGSANLVDELLAGTYQRLEDPAAQDAFFQQVGTAAFSRLTTSPDARTLVQSLRQGTEEGRVLVAFDDADEQTAIAGTRLSGALPVGAGERPDVGVYVNDLTSSKLSYYLERDVAVRSVGCRDGRQALQARLDLRSTTPGDPANLPEYVTGGAELDLARGDQLLRLFLVGPAQGRLADVRLDGEPVAAETVRWRGRPAVRVEVDLPAGATARLAWSMRSGPGQTGSPAVTTTPARVPAPLVTTLASACR